MNQVKVLNINKNIATIEYRGKVFISQIKYSENHGYCAEFVSINSFHRVEIDKARLM